MDTPLASLPPRQGPAALRFALGLSGAEQPLSLSRALERALKLRSPQAVEALVRSYHLTPSLTRLDQLAEDRMFRRAHLAASRPDALASVGKMEAALSDPALVTRRSSQLAFSNSTADKLHPATCPESANGFSMLMSILHLHEPTYGDELRLRWSMACDLEVATRATALAAARAGKEAPPIVDAKLNPTWFDLFIWAVCVGERKIARTLWREAEQPLRAAVIASRLARSLGNTLARPDARTSFLHDADVYERWATGVLDAATGAEAHLLLLYTNSQFGSNQRSCLELATDSTATSCRLLAAHPAVMETLHLLFSGFLAPIPPQFESGANAFDAHQRRMFTAGSLELSHLYKSVDPLVSTWCEKLQNALQMRVGGHISLYRDAQPATTVEGWVHLASAPRVKFHVHALSCLAYFTYLSYAVTTLPVVNLGARGRIDAHALPNNEIAAWIWTGCLLIEQVKQLLRRGRARFKLQGTSASLLAYLEEHR